MVLDVQIWSDVVCPWCAVGRARFRAALDDTGHEARVTWRSYQLDPSAPAVVEGAYVERLARKYRVSVDQAHAMVDRMVHAGAEDGIDFRFDLARPGNTFDAHRLLHHARTVDRQDEVKSRFLRGYHTEGAAIGDHDDLRRLAVDAGLDADDVDEVLATDRHADDVRGDVAAARDLDITGVPFFLLRVDGHDQPYGIPGAQPTDVFTRVLAKVTDVP